MRTVRRRRGVIALGILGAGTLLLGACSGSSSGGGSSTGASASTPASSAGSPAASSTSAPGAPIGTFDGTKLVLSRWSGDPWTAAQTSAAAEWSKDTGGSIEMAAVPYENLHDKQALTQSGAGGYDILYVHPAWFGEYAKAGYLAPIDDLLSDPSKNPSGLSADSYLPSVLAQGKYNGKQYCLPDFVSTIVVAYRKDWFDAAGLAAPKTLDDVVADAQKLNGQNGAAGIVLPGKRTGAVSDVMGTFLTAQNNWWYDGSAKPSLDSAAAEKAVDYYVKFSKLAPKGMLNMAVDDAATTAAQGKAAIVIDTTPSLSALEDSAKSTTVGKWAYAPVAITSDKPAGELIYWNWCITAKSKNRDAAYSFIQWWTDTQQQAKVAVQAATLGATKAFYQDADVTAKLPFLPAVQAALTNANPQPSLSAWPKIQDQIELAVQNAILGKKTAAQAAQSMQDALSQGLG